MYSLVLCVNLQWKRINWAESNAFWIMSCICQGNGTVDERLCIANIRSEFNLGSNNQGHYGSTLKEIETDMAASLPWTSWLKVITFYQLQLKAGMLVDGTGGKVKSSHKLLRLEVRYLYTFWRPLLII